MTDFFFNEVFVIQVFEVDISERKVGNQYNHRDSNKNKIPTPYFDLA